MQWMMVCYSMLFWVSIEQWVILMLVVVMFICFGVYSGILFSVLLVMKVFSRWIEEMLMIVIVSFIFSMLVLMWFSYFGWFGWFFRCRCEMKVLQLLMIIIISRLEIIIMLIRFSMISMICCFFIDIECEIRCYSFLLNRNMQMYWVMIRFRYSGSCSQCEVKISVDNGESGGWFVFMWGMLCCGGEVRLLVCYDGVNLIYVLDFRFFFVFLS